MDSCIFCNIINGNVKSRKIYETKYSMAIFDAFPLKEGHTLIISKDHKKKIQDLTPQENLDIFSTLHFLINHIEKAANGNSTLIAIHNGEKAGQEIPHVHIHIVPIKESDKSRAIHSMFSKEKYLESEIDKIYERIKNSIENGI